MKQDDNRFTKIASDLMLGMRDLVNWGIDTGNTTPDKLQLTVAARKEAANKLIEAGMSQRQAAKVLGVSVATINRDVLQNVTDIITKRNTGSEATKAHRAAIAANAAAEGVTAVPSGKYRIIYADPPWDYGAHAQPDYHTEQRDHYPVMTLEEICAEPVKEWLETNAVLFLWTTSPFLEKTFEVVHAWDFTYKTSFIWDKIGHNMGHYNSVRHEFLLICTRGACKPDTNVLIDSVQRWESTKHSEKPVEFYYIIERLYTHGRRLEMYGRRRRPGWDCYGHVAEIKEGRQHEGVQVQAAARI